MARPPDRCKYEHDVPDYFKPYCCFRESWRKGRCIWHAPATGKSAKVLEGARVSLSWGYPEHSRDRWIDRRGERLDGAFLKEADLRTVSFEGCTLAGANATGANLRGGDVANADLREATLAGADAKQCRFDDTVLEKADLSGANLEGATLRDASLKKADLSGANLEDADLTGADLRRANLEGANLRGADLPGCRLFKAELSGAELIDVDLTGAILRDASLRDAYLLSATLEGASLESADLTGVDAQRAAFVDANLVGCRLEDATLAECEFTDADASRAVFDGAMLERARMDSVKLYDASFVGTGVYAASFAGAAINETTEFGEYVRYDPRYDGELPDETATDGGDADEETEVSGGEPVEESTKAAGSYRVLAGLARDNELPERARDFHLRRKAVRRRRHRDRGHWGRWIGATSSALFTGYGERPGRVLASALVVVLGSGLLYPLGWIRPVGGDELVWYSGGTEGIAAAAIEGLTFSIQTFTTGATAYRAVGPGRALAAVESVLGILALAALVFVLARRGTR